MLGEVFITPLKRTDIQALDLQSVVLIKSFREQSSKICTLLMATSLALNLLTDPIITNIETYHIVVKRLFTPDVELMKCVKRIVKLR